MAQLHRFSSFLNALLFLLPSFLVTSIESRTFKDNVPFLHKLSLTHRDFASHDNSTLYERMQKAVQRSNLRVQHLQESVLASASSGGSYNTPVYAASGAFVTTVAMGTPPVSFEALVDTGSDLVWLQCQPCVNCYNASTNTIFDPSSSSSYTKVACSDSFCKDLGSHAPCDTTCSYTYEYGDGSLTKGDLSYDTLTLSDTSGNSHGIPSFAFGCSHDHEGVSPAGADGLLGFGQGSVSLPSQLSSGKFSYCLQTITDSSSQTSPLFIGTEATLSGSNIQSTKILPNPAMPTYYYLGLNGISVGDNAVSIPPGTFDLQSDGTGGLIIDSGTTITYLLSAAYTPVMEAFKSSITLSPSDGSSVTLDLCYSSSGNVPSLTFHFDGADLLFPVENYFVHMGEGLFCIAIAKSNLQSSLSILGNIQQQNFHILYDSGAGVLSFTPATCDSL